MVHDFKQFNYALNNEAKDRSKVKYNVKIRMLYKRVFSSFQFTWPHLMTQTTKKF